MADQRLDRDVSFSTKHGRALHPTLNAFSALWRIDDLISDLDRLQTAYEHCPQIHHPRNSGFEAASYCAVAYVTCLEWHASSLLKNSDQNPICATIESRAAVS